MAIPRLIFEINKNAGLHPFIYGYAMMMYHAYNEFVGAVATTNRDIDTLVIGITCLVLAVKFNEDYLNSTDLVLGKQKQGIRTSRSAKIFEYASRAVLAYGQKSSSSFEEFISVKNRLRDSICEYSVLRIVGNYATCIPVVEDCHDEQKYFSYYASPKCLNHPKPDSL
jgi:hypothetical protein